MKNWQIDIEKKTTDVFKRTLFTYTDKQPRLIVEQGGTSSSKTYSVLQLLFFILIHSQKALVISVCSQTLPHLKLGAIRDFEHILLSFGIIPDTIRNKTENTYKIGKSIIEFFGTDNMAKVHGPRRDILFINEANYIKYDIFNQLDIRTRETIIIDYNPVQEFWYHENIQERVDHEFIKSTYKDNQFLSSEVIKSIESRKHNDNWWRVYGLGELGRFEGAVFANWRFGEFDESLPHGFGLDFGYYPDPDAMVKCAIDKKHKKMYWKECLYENNNGTEDLRKSIGNHASRNNLIIADSAEKRLIADLKKDYNVRGVVKNPGSVAENLKLMNDYEHIITEDSVHLAKEFQNYCWDDKKAGVPIDSFNHCIDAGRYYFMNWNKKRRPMTA